MQEELSRRLGMTRTGPIYRTEFAANARNDTDGKEKFLSQTQAISRAWPQVDEPQARRMWPIRVRLLDGKICRRGQASDAEAR